MAFPILPSNDVKVEVIKRENDIELIKVHSKLVLRIGVKDVAKLLIGHVIRMSYCVQLRLYKTPEGVLELVDSDGVYGKVVVMPHDADVKTIEANFNNKDLHN